jgi:hypothetical protein
MTHVRFPPVEQYKAAIELLRRKAGRDIRVTRVHIAQAGGNEFSRYLDGGEIGL